MSSAAHGEDARPLVSFAPAGQPAASALALSRVQWGNRETRGHDHVLLLDAGAWSAAQATGRGSGERVLDEEKEQARRYLALLPERDRVMLVAEMA